MTFGKVFVNHDRDPKKRIKRKRLIFLVGGYVEAIEVK